MATTKSISQLSAVVALAGDEPIEIAQLSSTVTITGITLSAAAADNSYNDSALGLIAAGFAINDRVNVVGFTGNVVNNIYSGVITALTTGKMTIGGTDGDVIVNDAAGESVTISKWESYRTTAQEIADLASAGGASTTQPDEQISGFIASPSNKSYTIALKMAHAGTITEATTKSLSGTCTATWKINTTALGGTANSVSSSEQSQSHASANAFAAGDDIVLTVSSNSSCADMSFTLKYTRTLA